MEPAVAMALGRVIFPFLHHGTTLETRGFKRGFKARPKTASQALAGPHSGGIPSGRKRHSMLL